MMTNRPNGILYLGVTADLIRRVWQHREGLVEGFTKRYGLTRLVYVERHPDIGSAIRREMTMKHWSRTWKVRLILRDNRNGQISTTNCCDPWMAGTSPAMTHIGLFSAGRLFTEQTTPHVMPGLVPGIHVFQNLPHFRGWPGQARP